MANVLNRVSKEYLRSVNTPDFPSSVWVINPDLSAVLPLASKYWIITGDVVTAMNAIQMATVDDNEFAASMSANGGPSNDAVFGDGVDGDIVVSVNTTLNQDLYPNTYTVNAGVTVNTAGFRIIARRGISNNGTIQNNGNNAAGSAAGTGAPTGTLGGGGDGIAGTNGVGGAGANLNTQATPGYGGAGGAGGSGSSGVGGAGGLVNALAAGRVRPRRLEILLAGVDFDSGLPGLARFQGGAAGGAGAGGGGANTGGGSGGGGGILMLAAPLIFNSTTGIIQTLGGSGGNGSGGNTGGGGGGGGGILVGVHMQIRNRGSALRSGGAAGAGAGTGTAGVAGAVGRLMLFPIT